MCPEKDRGGHGRSGDVYEVGNRSGEGRDEGHGFVRRTN